MTEQERFEADYLAAFPKSELILESRDEEGRPTSPFVHYAEQVWLQQNKRHEAEIAELRAKAVPDDWKLVPVEPTREQLIAAHTRYWSGLASANISDYWEEVSKPLWQATWSAMLAAAPEPKS